MVVVRRFCQDLLSATDAHTLAQTTYYQYERLNRLNMTTFPDNRVETRTYDAVNRLKKVGGFATVRYTLDDKISKITYGNGEVATYTYDNRDRPTQILDKSGSTKEMDLNYTYDGTGNVLSINGNSEKYGYDYLNRLTSSTGPWGTYTYTFNQVGNRVKMVQGSTTTVYCYGSFNRLSGYYTTTSCSSPAVSYTYDSNGNTITKTGGWTYSYDYENRLTKVAQSGTTKQLNSYDGDGERVKQVAGSSTFTYSYQGLNILYDKNVTGSTTTVTKHFYAGGLQVAKMVGTGVYYLHEDALGSTRLVATSTVSIKFKSNYVPYGSNYAITGKEVFMYTGKPYDAGTGLYYMGARFYDTTIGRFITQDSYAGDHNDPMTMNLYIYARDNPEKYTDPSGHYIYARTSSCSGGKCTTTTIIDSNNHVTTMTIVSKDVVTVVPTPDNPRPGDTGAAYVAPTGTSVSPSDRNAPTGGGPVSESSGTVTTPAAYFLDPFKIGLREEHIVVGAALSLLGAGEIGLALSVAFSPSKGPTNPTAKDELIVESFLTGSYLLTMGGWNIWDAFQPSPSKGFILGGACIFGYCP